MFSSGPFRLARKTGSPIIPTFVIRNRDDTHLLIFEKPIILLPKSTTELKKTAACDTCKYTEFFSDYVKKYPCHFAMALIKQSFNAPNEQKDFEENL